MAFAIYTLILTTFMISAFAAEENPKFKFEPMVGNGTHPETSHGAGSQEVELGSTPYWEADSVNWNNPSDVFSNLTKHLPKDIQKEARAHFEQADGERGLVDVDDARRLAKLYGQKNMERIKKEDPVLHAALTKPLPSIKKTKDSEDHSSEESQDSGTSSANDGALCIVS